MIAKLIRWSIANRFLVLLATLMATAWGVWSLSRIPLDADAPCPRFRAGGFAISAGGAP